MDRIRSYKSLIYLCARKWKMLVAAAVLMALLLGVMQGISLISAAKKANSGEAWEKEVDDYTYLKMAYEEAIAKDQAVIEREQRYIDSSVVLNCQYTCVIDLAVKLDLNILNQMSNIPESDSMEYMARVILGQYMTCFNNVPISEIPFLYTIHYRLEDVFWQEIISVEQKDDYLIEIICLGTTEEEAIAIADMLKFFFTSRESSISETSYPHTLELVSYVTKNEVDTSRYESVIARIGAKSEAEKNLAMHQSMLDALIDPNQAVAPITAKVMVFQIAMMMLSGGVIGAFLMGILLIFNAIRKHAVLTSKEIEENCHLTSLGVLPNDDPNKRRWNDKWHMECVPAIEKEALRYSVASISNQLNTGRILFTSSLENTEKIEKAIVPLIKELTEKGFEVCFKGNPKCNADFVESIKEFDEVILVECGEVSSMKAIDEVKTICYTQNVKGLGFVFLCW